MAVNDWNRNAGTIALDRSRPSVLIVAAKWWSLSARLAVALHRHGCNVGAVCPVGHPLTHVSGINRIYRYRGLFSLSNVQRALKEYRPDIVIPGDDGVVAQLHAVHELDPSLQSLIERSLGPPESYSVVESRYRFLSAALKLGICVPRTRIVNRADDLVTWHADIGSATVLKVDGESGGNGVRISHSLDESLAAWRALRAPRSFATAWKRLAIDRDPLALWLHQRQSAREITVQKFIPGRPANSMLVCWRGELLSMVSVIVVAAAGPTGAATIVRVIQNEEMKRAAELVVSRLNLSGFYGLDFIIESGTGVPYLIEMNPRCTQLGHIEFADRGCLAGVLSAVLRGEPRPQVQNPVPHDTIALFPQALAAGDACRPHLEASYHDVPSEEPQLMRELMLKSWPQRRWVARLYHAFKPIGRANPLLFESLDTTAQ
jgi:carbamoylphosphate synthase large subunit